MHKVPRFTSPGCALDVALVEPWLSPGWALDVKLTQITKNMHQFMGAIDCLWIACWLPRPDLSLSFLDFSSFFDFISFAPGSCGCVFLHLPKPTPDKLKLREALTQIITDPNTYNANYKSQSYTTYFLCCPLFSSSLCPCPHMYIYIYK